jgi:predicted GNAT family acetyltransferase
MRLFADVLSSAIFRNSSKWAQKSVSSVVYSDTPDVRARIREYNERAHSERALFVLDAEGRAVATSAFHGHAYDTVQLGGVYRFSAARNRGYGRGVVAGSLLIGRDEGIKSALLFTWEHNAPARRMYEAIGFHAIGEYGLVLFSETSQD